uniref:Uncharacterized protein n=1 Tax=Anguilla anguilla TaxID=7936 RepID=A0A0E9TR33_ANGAN
MALLIQPSAIPENQLQRCEMLILKELYQNHILHLYCITCHLSVSSSIPQSTAIPQFPPYHKICYASANNYYPCKPLYL